MASRGRLSPGASASNNPSTRSAQSAAHTATIRRSASLSVCGEPIASQRPARMRSSSCPTGQRAHVRRSHRRQRRSRSPRSPTRAARSVSRISRAVPAARAERGQRFGERGAPRGEHPFEQLASGVRQRQPQTPPPGRLAPLDPARLDQTLDEARGSGLGEPERPAQILDRPAGRGGDDDQRGRRGTGLPDDRGRGGLLRVRELERQRAEEVREPIGVYGRARSGMHDSCILTATEPFVSPCRTSGAAMGTGPRAARCCGTGCAAPGRTSPPSSSPCKPTGTSRSRICSGTATRSSTRPSATGRWSARRSRAAGRSRPSTSSTCG